VARRRIRRSPAEHLAMNTLVSDLDREARAKSVRNAVAICRMEGGLPSEYFAWSNSHCSKRVMPRAGRPLILLRGKSLALFHRLPASHWQEDSPGDSEPAGSREGICRINAACSPRRSAPSDQLAPDGRLPGTVAPTPDTQGEER
jgi:hypothetical protein